MAEADQTVTSGLKGARDRMLEHLAKQGLLSVAPLDDQFDPLFHEAIAVEPGSGRDGLVVKVHRRGWILDSQLIRAAMVTVCQGAPDESPAEEQLLVLAQSPEESVALGPSAGKAPRPRRRRTGGTIPGFDEGKLT